MKISKILTLVVVTLLAILAFSSCSDYIFGNDECEHKSTTTSTFAKATCSTEGLRRTVCSECGAILRVEEIEKIAHKEVIDEAIESTCSEYGRTEGKHCSVCDQVIVPRKVVAKKPHIEVVDEAVTATCVNVGFTEGKHCSVCNEVTVAPEVIEMKPHTEVIDQAVPASCTKAGLTEGKHCSVCGAITVAQKETYTEHNFWNSVVVKEATKSEDGLIEKYCNCGSKITEVVHATGSLGLKFASSSNGTCYVSSIGTCSDTDVIIPAVSPRGDRVTSIGNSAFRDCTGLTSIVIPDSVTSIDNFAFEDCTGLTRIVIGDSVTRIGYRAFEGCTGITRIVIPDSVTSIGDNAFEGCTGLTSIVIGDSVTSIDYDAFYNCTGLTSVVIGDSVISIGDYVFYNCDSLTSVVIPDSVTRIGDYAFEGCTGITDVYYTGTAAEWANISIGYDNYYLENATIHYNYVPAN